VLGALAHAGTLRLDRVSRIARRLESALNTDQCSSAEPARISSPAHEPDHALRP
jgi:hypothetical protein